MWIKKKNSNSISLVFLMGSCLLLGACETTQDPAVQGIPAGAAPAMLSNLNTAKAFNAASATTGSNGGLPGSIIVTDQSFVGLEGNTRVSYDAALKSFTLTIAQDVFSFNQTFSQIDQAASSPSQTTYVEGDDRFILQKAGAANDLNPALVFDYVTYGYWTADNVSGFGEASGWLTFGFLTAPADIPPSGNVTYNGVAEGKLYRFGDKYNIYGDVSLEANFTNGAVTADFTQMMQQQVFVGGTLGAAGLWRDFTATGSIASGTSLYSGTTSTANGVYQGDFSGGFFGPAGSAPAETGGIWSLSGASETASGAFMGK